MVVAQCDEKLEWLEKEALRYRKIRVYTKCGKTVEQINPAFKALSNVEFIPSPNVGSNDYAVVHHIISTHGRLANMTVFCEGGEHRVCIPDAVLRPELPAPSLTSLQALWTMWKTAAVPTISAQAHMPRRTHQHPRFGSQSFTYPWIAGVSSNLSSFRFKRNYRFLESNRTFRMLRSRFTNMGEWLIDLVGEDAARYLFTKSTAVAYGGFFSVQREEIERYPIALYEAIARQQVAPNEEVLTPHRELGPQGYRRGAFEVLYLTYMARCRLQLRSCHFS